MQTARRYRIPAILCALAVLLCELIARPYANMGVCDDGPYIMMARTLATTGHIAYNGWPAAMLGWQIYLGALFIKIFGFSYTAVRASTILVAMVTAFILQRTLVRSNLSERDATIGTLALVLSPMYLLLSATFMSDIFGAFAIILCLYCCMRALLSASQQRTLLWIAVAVASNALFGTCRQVAWLGILALVPSTLWLLRAQRRVLIGGAAMTAVGVAFVFACLQWFARQPYIQPEHLLPHEAFPMADIFIHMLHAFLEIPFLLLPIMALCLAGLWSGRRALWIAGMVFAAYIAFSIYRGFIPLLQPPMGDWVTVFGTVHEVGINGEQPIFLTTWIRSIITFASLGGSLGFALSFLRPRKYPAKSTSPTSVTWKQLAVLLGVFSTVYTMLLIPRAASVGLSDRYVLELAIPALLLVLRYYEEAFQPQLPLLSIVLVGVVAVGGVIMTRNTFALYSARVAIAAELRAHGIPDTSVDNGWEYNFNVELEHAPSLNDARIITPAHFYKPTPPLPAGPCLMYWQDSTPHITPIYAIAYDPTACYGPTAFAPVHYARWPFLKPGTLYVVRFTPSSKP